MKKQNIKGIKKTIGTWREYLDHPACYCEIWYDEKDREVWANIVEYRTWSEYEAKHIVQIVPEEVIDIFGEMNMENLRKHIEYGYYKNIPSSWIDSYYDNKDCE